MVDYPSDIETSSYLCFFPLGLWLVDHGVTQIATLTDFNFHNTLLESGQPPSTSITSISSIYNDKDERGIHNGSSLARAGRLCSMTIYFKLPTVPICHIQVGKTSETNPMGMSCWRNTQLANSPILLRSNSERCSECDSCGNCLPVTYSCMIHFS